MTDILFDTKWRSYGRSIADRIDASGDCWLWTGALNKDGYGQVSINGGMQSVHRVVWQVLVGPIPPELEVDHLCRNPPCCNPDHLEPVTHAENMRRGNAGLHERIKTHCSQGHPYSEENTLRRPNGWRRCRECNRQSTSRRSSRYRELREAQRARGK